MDRFGEGISVMESDFSHSLKTLIYPIKLKNKNEQTKTKNQNIKKHQDVMVNDSGYTYLTDLGERFRLDSSASGSGNSHLRKT